MARITIDDLPAAPELPPEQEGQVQGAGPRPFKPGIEPLEGRQLMAAHLGAALAPELPSSAKVAALDPAPQHVLVPARYRHHRRCCHHTRTGRTGHAVPVLLRVRPARPDRTHRPDVAGPVRGILR